MRGGVCVNIHRLQIGFKCCLLFNKIQLYEVIFCAWGMSPARPSQTSAGRGSGHGPVSGPGRACVWAGTGHPTAHTEVRGCRGSRRACGQQTASVGGRVPSEMGCCLSPLSHPTPSSLSYQVLEALLGPPRSWGPSSELTHTPALGRRAFGRRVARDQGTTGQQHGGGGHS